MSAMPDLIFTILFFFMIATHIRENSPQLQYEEPSGTNLQKLKKSQAVIDIYVGKNDETGRYDVQVNNSLVEIDRLPVVLLKARSSMPYDAGQLCASVHADCKTPMSVINKVKTALREARILRVNYGGTVSDEVAAAADEYKP